jgi:hypothetical protein
VTPCSILNILPRFGRTCRFRIQDRNINTRKNGIDTGEGFSGTGDLSEQMEVRSTLDESTRSLLYYPEKGCSRFLLKVSKHLQDKTTRHYVPAHYNFISTAVRTSHIKYRTNFTIDLKMRILFAYKWNYYYYYYYYCYLIKLQLDLHPVAVVLQ